jgi:hypothetical protein
MKKFLMALVVLTIASGPVFAGPNEFGVLYIHNTGVLYAGGPEETPVPTCAGIVNQVAIEDAHMIWKVYAAFPIDASPRLKGLAWGYGISENNAGYVYIEANGPQNESVFSVLEGVNGSVWPGMGGDSVFVGMGFTDSARVATVNELWWFAGTAYAGLGGEPQSICLIPHLRAENRFFLDDAFPPHEDAIMGYGCLGFGQPGFTPPCPVIPPTGACCFTDGTCQILREDHCVAASGVYYGGACGPNNEPCPQPPPMGICCDALAHCTVTTEDGCVGVGTWNGAITSCVGDPCPPVPTENKSWGQIKNSYR